MNLRGEMGFYTIHDYRQKVPSGSQSRSVIAVRGGDVRITYDFMTSKISL